MDRIFLEDVSRCVEKILPWIKYNNMTLVNAEAELLSPLPKLSKHAHNFCIETIKAAVSVLLEKIKANKLPMPAYDSILSLSNDSNGQRRTSNFSGTAPQVSSATARNGANYLSQSIGSPSAPHVGQTPQSGGTAPAGNGLSSSGGSGASSRAPLLAIHNPNESSYLPSYHAGQASVSATMSDIDAQLSRFRGSSPSTPHASTFNAPATSHQPSQQGPPPRPTQPPPFQAIHSASQVYGPHQPPPPAPFTAVYPDSQVYGPRQPYFPPTSHSSSLPSSASSSSALGLVQHPPARPQTQAFPGPPPTLASLLLPPSTVGTLGASPGSDTKPAIPRYLSWYAESKCPFEARQGFCRSRNLRFKKTCTFEHLTSFSHDDAILDRLSPSSPDYRQISLDFHTNWKLSMRPEITKIEQVFCNDDINHAFQAKAIEFASAGINLSLRQLYHGTHEHNIEKVLRDGFQPPSDCAVHENCPTWGKYCKDLQTSPCISSCSHCYGDLANRHSWAKCHMFGLGIYFADQSSKSDRYVRPTKKPTERRMLLVDVLLGDPHIAKCLSVDEEYHDYVIAPEGKNSIIALGKTSPKSGREVLNNECTLI